LRRSIIELLKTLEPLTHLLFGANLGRAGLNRKTAYATLTLTLAAEAPDLDVVGRFRGAAFGFEHHRGFTHSFLGGVLVAAFVVAFVYLFDRLRRRPPAVDLPPPRWGLLLLYAYVACLSHILLDFTNNYGVRPFWPFSARWYSWDIVFILEPVLWVLLIGGLVAPLLTALINEEIGVRQKGFRGKLAARVALAGVLVTWGVRDYEHRRAVGALESRLYQDETPLRVSAYPQMGNPLSWYGVVETAKFYATMNVDASTPEADPENNLHIYFRPEPTPATEAVRKTALGRFFFSWARYPIAETETLIDPAGYRVRLFDLRFGDPQLGQVIGKMGGKRPLTFEVELDPQLREVLPRP
jgi:inner membrane protein